MGLSKAALFIFIIQPLISQLAVAQASSVNPSSCQERLRPELITWTQNLNDEAGTPIVPTPKRVLRRTQGPDESYRTDFLAAHLIVKVTKEIDDQAARKLTEFMYVVRDEQAIPGSSANATERDIPGWVVNAMCLEQCNQDEKQRFREISKSTLAQLQSEGTRRLSINEITDEVQTHFQGLTMVARGIESRRSSILDFQILYQQTLLNPTGKLIATDAFRVSLAELASGQTVSVDSTNVKKAILRFYQDFTVSRYEGRKDWLATEKILSSPGGILSAKESASNNPYLWLARYMESAPVAVVSVLRANPEISSAMCNILFELDQYLFSTKWKKSFDGLWDGIKIPLWVIGLAFVPILVSGGPLAIMWVGVMVLKAASWKGMADSYNKRDDLTKWRRFHANHLSIGVASSSTLSTLQRYDQDIIAAEKDLGLSLALEIGSIGFAKAMSHRTLEKFRNMSDSELFAVFARQLQSKSAGGAIRSLLNQRVPMDTFKAARGMSYENFNFARVKELIRSTPRADLEKLFFSQKDMGFARTLFLTEAGVDVATTLYQAGTQDYFQDIKPFEHLFGRQY